MSFPQFLLTITLNDIKKLTEVWLGTTIQLNYFHCITGYANSAETHPDSNSRGGTIGLGDNKPNITTPTIMKAICQKITVWALCYNNATNAIVDSQLLKTTNKLLSQWLNMLITTPLN